MKRYIIAVKSVATESNTNFYGNTNWYFKGKSCGKSCEILSDVLRAHELNADSYKEVDKHLIMNYGYTTKAGAGRGLKAQKEQDEFENSLGWWLSKSHVVEVEV